MKQEHSPLTGILWVTLLGLVASFVGMLYGRVVAQKRHGLEIGFDTSPFANGVLQGEVVKVPLVVKNGTGQPIILRNVHKSCGCISVFDSTGSDLVFPQTLKPSDSTSWEVSLSTASKQGLSVQPLQVEYEQGGAVQLSQVDLSLHVCARPHSLGGAIELDSERLEGTCTIGDAFPMGGVRFRELEFSQQTISEAILEELGSVESQPESVTGVCKVVPRYRLRVRGVSSERDYATHIGLVPENEEYVTVNIPVHFRATHDSTDWLLYPSELILPLNGNGETTRTVRIVPPKNLEPELLRAQPSIESIKATVRSDGRDQLMTVIVSGKTSGQRGGEISMIDASGKEVARIPIRIL